MKYLLLPFALTYGLVATIRNKLFDWGILKSKSYSKPVITVGNLTVGGTGKTPHIEYLVRLLQPSHNVTVVSRGYGRKTHGYIEVQTESQATNVGDEPLQIKHKFPKTRVVVDEKRTHAIDKLLDSNDPPDVFLLDDAFQHRKVKAGLQIVLIDYNRPVFNDCMMPAGRLREPKRNINRADLIVVTKCPDTLSEKEKAAFIGKLKIKSQKPVFFTKIKYGNLTPIGNTINIDNLENTKVSVVTGIAQPQRIYQYLKDKKAVLETIEFPDHHFFTISDMATIRKKFRKSDSQIIVTTEKDAMRLESFTKELTEIPIFYIPIEIVFTDGRQEEFNKIVSDFTEPKNN